ncbi:helix-turn-helix domain-containing protein [Niveibacterium terrae]|uniref:helix-turn-helix transcriptional regulator n=1 Tax=Niveibacterium terrae TaxID=3373598 RepID=UPI003A8ED41D
MSASHWILPAPELRPFIDRYWSWEGGSGDALPMMLPGTGAELFFHIGEPFLMGAPGALPDRAPRAHLNYAHDSPLMLVADGAVAFVSVRIRSGALRHLCAQPIAELANAQLDAREIWGIELAELSARLSETADLAARARLLDRWLLGLLAAHKRGHALIDDAALRLYYRHRDTQIDALAGHYRISRRHFERLFKQELGCTPKSFLRTARFHQTVRDLFLAPDSEILGLALDHGYYDQSHFIHEFSAFVGERPTRFFAHARNAHFYAPSLKEAGSGRSPR